MKILLITFILLLSGCAKTFNNEIATYKVVGDKFHITVSGERGNMAHDPISLIFRGSTKVSETLVVPRIQGVVSGSEIPPQEGYVPYKGEVLFNGNQMIIRLIYDYIEREDSPSWGVIALWPSNYLLWLIGKNQL